MIWRDSRQLTSSFATLTSMMLVALLLVAGCGGGDKEEAPPTPATRSMVPAGTDTTQAAPGDSTLAATGLDEMADPVGDPMDAAVAQDSPATSPRVQETLTTGSATPPAKARTTAQPAVSGGDFSLQVGSFQERSNADNLAARIKNLGHTARVESAVVSGVTYHRVFVRGLADRTAAENLGEELRAQLGINYLVLRKP